MTLHLKNVKKVFGKLNAVDNLSFNLKGGDILGFVGPNGAGKTTTLRIISTLDEPTSGDVLIDGQSILESPELARKMIGFVPDSLPVHQDMSVHEYLDFFARAYAIPYANREDMIDDLEEFTGLLEYRDRLLGALSKGMKQRVSIARALIHDPKFLLMDEPAAGLDPRARIQLRELLKELSKQGKGILISSHILSELSEICNSAVFIERGKLLKFGSMDEITTHQTSTRKLIIRPIGDSVDLIKFLLLHPGIENALMNGKNIEVDYSGSDLEATDLLSLLIKKDFKLVEFKFKQQNLESVFMDITKGEVQ
jgi:ABC-2 type transport system ATP-binding protein